MQRELLLNGPIVVAFYVYSDFAQVMSVGCTSTGACMSVGNLRRPACVLGCSQCL